MDEVGHWPPLCVCTVSVSRVWRLNGRRYARRVRDTRHVVGSCHDGYQNGHARVLGVICRDVVSVLTDAPPAALLLSRLSQVFGKAAHNVDACDGRRIWSLPGDGPDEGASQQDAGEGRLMGEGHVHFLRMSV